MDNLPIGFAFKLAINNSAMKYYASLSTDEQNQITKYIQNCSNSNDAKEKIEIAVTKLSNGSIDFL